MSIDDLRTGWPEELLTGRYTIQISGGTIGGEILNDLGKLLTIGLHEPGNNTVVRVLIGGNPAMTILRDETGGFWPAPTGIKAVALVPVLTLVEVPGSQPRKGLLREIFDPLTGTQLTPRTRLRMATRKRRRRTRWAPTAMWDVLDNRLGRVVGRLTVPADMPRGTLAVILGETGHVAGFLMDDPQHRVPPRNLSFLTADHRPAAHIRKDGSSYEVDVSGGGLDPRLVLAGVMLQFAHLSTK